MFEFLFNQYKNASTLQIVLEAFAFVFGIISVVCAKKENIWVYPTGLIATIITAYLLFITGYLGDMMINGYFSIMSIYGWYRWTKKINDNNRISITRTNNNEKVIGIVLFFVTIFVVFGIYNFFDYEIKKDNQLKGDEYFNSLKIEFSSFKQFVDLIQIFLFYQ